jgi:hypothetical protein
VTVKAGAYNAGVPRDNPGPHPPKDAEYKSACSFAADGEMVAATAEGQLYDFASKSWKPSITAGYFNGKTALALSPPERPGWGRATIRTGNDRLDAGLWSTPNSPVLHYYRPLGGGVFASFEFYKPTLSGRTETIREVACVEVVIKDVPPGSTRTIWCDPARGFLPIREQHRNSFSDYVQELEYRKEEKRGWVLSGWERTGHRRDGSVVYSLKSEVKKLEFDVKFAVDAFSPNPPPASHVIVYADRAQKEEYLVRADGTVRLLKASEREKNFDELAKTNADGTPYVPPKK